MFDCAIVFSKIGSYVVSSTSLGVQISQVWQTGISYQSRNSSNSGDFFIIGNMNTIKLFLVKQGFFKSRNNFMNHQKYYQPSKELDFWEYEVIYSPAEGNQFFVDHLYDNDMAMNQENACYMQWYLLLQEQCGLWTDQRCCLM